MNSNSNRNTIYSIVVLLSLLIVSPTEAQIDCTIDLSKPGQMSDIASNALMHEFKKDGTKVREFLDAVRGKFADGKSLAAAAAKEFGIEEKVFFAATESYKHINCRHAGGGEEHSAPRGDGKVSQFAEDVLVHVVIHELGHALVREFDLPILGNEETAADTFATHYIVTRMEADRGLQILKARVSSLMFEASEVPREEWTVKGEHNSDARRAYQIVATAIAHDSETYSVLSPLVGMDESGLRKARDYGSEIHRSWRRILKPLWMPTGQKSSESSLQVDNESFFETAIRDGKMTAELRDVLRSFDWHSQVTLRFAAGNGGAGWSRSSRTITVQDGYIKRFNAQGKSIANLGAKTTAE